MSHTEDTTTIKVGEEPVNSYQLYPRNEEFAKRAAVDHIKNKLLIATNDDAMDFLAEMEMTTPVTNSNGEILISKSNEIYSL